MIGRNIRQIRQICQISLINLNFGKTQIFNILNLWSEMWRLDMRGTPRQVGEHGNQPRSWVMEVIRSFNLPFNGIPRRQLTTYCSPLFPFICKCYLFLPTEHEQNYTKDAYEINFVYCTQFHMNIKTWERLSSVDYFMFHHLKQLLWTYTFISMRVDASVVCIGHFRVIRHELPGSCADTDVSP